MSETEEIKKDVDIIRDDVKEIKDALLGNEFNQNNGVVKRLSVVETDVKELKEDKIKNKNLLLGLAMGAGIGGASMLEALVKMIIQAFK